MPSLLDPGLFSVIDTDSAIGVGWYLNFYETGTTTLKSTYPTASDAAAGTNANPNPLPIPANGRIPAVWYNGGIKMSLQDDIGVIKAGPRELQSTAFLVSVRDYGAIGDGITDDTAAIQAAIASGANAVFVPSGIYSVSSLLMPNVFGFVLYGEGTASVLKQRSGAANALIRWATASIVYNEQSVNDLAFTGTSGSQHVIDTSGAGGVTLRSIYITDVPATKSGIYVNGAAATYCHDHRLQDIQIYSNTAGHSGIRFGALSADSELVDYIFNGNFVTNYGIYADIGAQSLLVNGGHSYNASINVAYFAGTNNGFGFVGVCFDNATNDLVYMTNVGEFTFTGCRFQAVKSGYSGVNIAGTSNGVSFVNGRWDGAAGALSCVVAAGTTSGVSVYAGQVPSVANFTTPFNLTGAYSSARGLAGFMPFGLQWVKTGVQATAQPQATTQYLGEGASTTEVNAAYVLGYDSLVKSIYIAVSVTPAAGQTFTYRARRNGADIGSALVINNGTLNGTITLNQAFSKYDRLTISAITSATSGATTASWVAEIVA
jgi:hypothetical protein